MLLVLLVPALSIYASVLVNENKAANAEKDISILRARIETNTRILESDHATVELLVKRSDQLEQRHDAIMTILMSSARAGSGYTWLPGEKKN